MSIEKSDQVDGMGIDARKGEAVLMISDHLDWADKTAHFSILEQKIDSYIKFVQSGQLEQVLPQARGLTTRINLVYQHEPTSEAKAILDSVAQQLSELKLKFTYEGLPEAY